MVRALASHQCDPGLIPRLGVICGLSLLVLYSAPRDFSPGTQVSPLREKSNTAESLFDPECMIQIARPFCNGSYFILMLKGREGCISLFP